MKKKVICLVALLILLLICIITYVRPLSLLDTIRENNRIDIILNEFEIKDGEPNIESFVYNDITTKQKDAILDLLKEYNYRKTIGTLFSNGSITDLDDKTLTIFVYDDNSSVAAIIVSSAGKIAVNDKSYTMEDAKQLIEQIIEIVDLQVSIEYDEAYARTDYTYEELSDMPAEELLDLFICNGLVINDELKESFTEEELQTLFKEHFDLWHIGVSSMSHTMYMDLAEQTKEIYDIIAEPKN